MNSPITIASAATPRAVAGGPPVGLAAMHPANFAMVMATGIISIACWLLDLALAAQVLFAANIAFYGILWILAAVRLVRFPQRVLGDLFSHARGVGFFTTVAATCVLGSQFLVIAQRADVALALWILGIVLWAIFTYTIFTAMTVQKTKPDLAAGINGGWLVAVVAAQSVAVLGAQLAPLFPNHAGGMLFFSLAMWLGAGMLYIWIISLIFYRYTFFPMNPADLSPPYWVNMGAMAISTLGGSFLVAAAPHSPLLMDVLPFIKGLTLLFWATATWWIPMLLVLGVWRHVFSRFPVRYDALYWGAVFPLGMYTVCTIRLSQVLGAPYLMPIPRVFIWVSLAAWTLVFAGLVHRLASRGNP